MIYWITTRRHSYTIRKHLAHFGKPIADQVCPLTYGSVDRRRLPVGCYVFTDIERLSDSQISRYSSIAEGMKADGSAVLNYPRDVKRRYALLKGLADQKYNRFNVFRVSELDGSERYPVFLRCENDHNGSISELLNSRDELTTEIRLQSRNRFLFHDRYRNWHFFRSGRRRKRQLLVTEFCDTSDDNGVFRKFSAFNVGGVIIARHLFFGMPWLLKEPRLLTPQWREEELNYVRSNPHAADLKKVFEFARIDYGRIDYSLLNGKIQTWEINTNPMTTTPADLEVVDRLAVQDTFVPQFNAALSSLTGVTCGST